MLHIPLYGIANISTSGPAPIKFGSFPLCFNITSRNSGIFGKRSKQNDVANKPRSSDAKLFYNF